ncbi:JAB domain-containing protein [Sphingomonas sp. PB4P5]|uniref:JAB domain-containing protein n=1 Tax=Parasphingomonas puruogangriensis TaxID=3096155 RepID=UPI002FCC4EBB
MPALPYSTVMQGHVRDAADVRALFDKLADATLECCGFAYLDQQWRLLGTRHTPPGHADGAAVPLRDVVRDVLDLEASAVVMAHNHPAGDPTPSEADLVVTRRLLSALEALDVRLVDHVVLAGARWASMRGMGLL